MDVRLEGSGSKRLLGRLTSIPALVAAFVIVALLAMGPLQGFDRVTNGPWAWRYTPKLVPFIQVVLDHISSRRVNLPILAVTALVVALVRRSWRPVVIAAVAEGGFYLLGLAKLFFSRPAPVLHNPEFFDGGWWADGRVGVSFPSGHAGEAVLIYGTVAYLIGTYTRVSPRGYRWIKIAVAVQALNCVVISFYLGYHWATDLVGGLLLGGVLLRILITLDRGRRSPHKIAVTDWRACAPVHPAIDPQTSPMRSSTPATTPQWSEQESTRP
jgi:membrane-associated phospholipid phosphatase